MIALHCHTRRIEVALTPKCSAKVRVLQCVAAVRLIVQGHLQNLRRHFGRDRGPATRTRCILPQRVDTTVQEAAAPQPNLATIKANFRGDILVLQALSGKQDDPSALL